MIAPALLVGAPRSGAGKTTVTVGLLAALARRGRQVRALKCGPDYIDAAFHAAASGAECANIDSWAMSPGHIAAILQAAAEPEALLILESAMGLFDGVAGAAGRSGAAADIAVRFGIPVVLALDIAGQAQSAGAVAAGFAAFDSGLAIGGAILNGVASPRHLRMATEGLERAGIPRLGWLPRQAEFTFQDRHLGLVQARERPGLAREVAALADGSARRSISTGSKPWPGRRLRRARPAAARPPGRSTRRASASPLPTTRPFRSSIRT